MGRALVLTSASCTKNASINDRKHIIHTDIMFERIEPLFVEYANESRTTNGPSIF